MIDLETMLREAQDRLRGRPETWWERNRWLVVLWMTRAGVALGFVFVAAYSLWVGYIVQHFVAKYW